LTETRVVTREWYAEIVFDRWPAGAECTLILTATLPPRAATFLIRSAVYAADGTIVTWPYGAGGEVQSDQQGFPALRWTVLVEQP
jgi:hypothetical protein